MTISRTHIRRGSLITAVLALLCSAFLALPASAEPAPFDDCPADTLCLYSGPGGTGERRDFTTGQNQEGYDATWDDKTLSAKNNTNQWACLYVDAGYGGLMQTVKPGRSDEYQTSDTRFVNTLSGHKTVPTRALCFTGYERCPDNRVCTFEEPAGRGPMTTHLPATDAAKLRYGNSYGTEAAPKSVFNRTKKHVCFYPQPTFSGTWTNPADGKVYGAYVVLRGDSTTVPAPFAGTFRSHELVNGTAECQ
ncbi:peptidase inhibitor family I36 protein [Streptomyces sp. CC208A]|uniref:peptidase inhibitor family I36 protein n=1 Tax=Streptomyces sp. CC208A TaxID=3044573 RepID=UPI0024A8FE5E|nr:peptidase inhibitor family I36 protein [Streptomyces sp. CC208A]